MPNCLADLQASPRAARARPLLTHASGVALVLDGAPIRHTADATFATTGTHLIEECPTQKQQYRYRLRPTLPLKLDCNLSESKIALCDDTYTKNKNICTKRREPLLLALLLGSEKNGQTALPSVLAIWLLQHSRLLIISDILECHSGLVRGGRATFRDQHETGTKLRRQRSLFYDAETRRCENRRAGAKSHLVKKA